MGGCTLYNCYDSKCFFFQAEDGIRDRNVTGVQTCALPILAWKRGVECQQNRLPSGTGDDGIDNITLSKPGVKQEIGRASCRERVYSTAGDERVKEKDMKKITESTIRQAQITAQPSKRTHVR